ncbi:chemotaxis protein [Exilibacterium tricleocarpae]|uniref:Chemotaxis protein n=1 Tax=Exilibacterium tricleocarpae TaxID=2591008 RepID=A0A545TLE7_9GAMM|nr:chemotaxis protein [Exilibacterium tricleocarpae]TQV78037.1 chemotaxis protein [Exilibacterium tricleocarpae]
MPQTEQPNYFVIAAIVAAELYQAMVVARQIALTASNARSLAIRAGQGAAGFRAITDFIDDLASVTVNASKVINNQAVAVSRIASDTARAEFALVSFDNAFHKASGAPYLSSLDASYQRTQEYRDSLREKFDKQVVNLNSRLEELARELRTAMVLSAMSRVEASQAGGQFEQPLNVIAQKVADAAAEIQRRVKYSRQMFSHLGKGRAD